MKFENFFRDLGPRPKGTTLDRINPALGYTPTNTRWETLREQNGHLSSNRLFEYGGHARMSQSKHGVSDWYTACISSSDGALTQSRSSGP
jgi:hypothetical protein